MKILNKEKYQETETTVNNLVYSKLDNIDYYAGGAIELTEQKANNILQFLSELVSFLVETKVLSLDDLKVLVDMYDVGELELIG